MSRIVTCSPLTDTRSHIAHRTSPLPRLPLTGNQSAPLAQHSQVDPKGFEYNKILWASWTSRGAFGSTSYTKTKNETSGLQTKTPTILLR